MSVLESFLKQHPQLLQSPTVSEQQAQAADRVVWEDLPDFCECYCCNGTGLVTAEAMRRFVNPSYDPLISLPVRCTRSDICGLERQRFQDPDAGDRQLEFHRYQARVELPELPKPVADRIHRDLKQEAKAAALRGDRLERIAHVRKQVQQILAGASLSDRILA